MSIPSSNRRWLILLAVLALWPCSAWADEKTPSDHHPVSVAAALDRDTLAMRIQLVVEPTKPLKVYESSLPWKNHHSMVIVAANLRGETIKPILPIDDPGPATLEIRDRLDKSGSVDLQARFPDLAAQLKKGDVLIFWSYRLRPIDGEPFERVGGWFAIPKVAQPQP